VPIGLWTLREVCERGKAWQSLDCRDFRSPSTCQRPSSPAGSRAQLAAILKSTGFDAKYLELEITESV